MTATAQRTQFSLQGKSISLDARVHAVRGDLADLALAGQIFVPHYARAMVMRCTVANIAICETNRAEAKQTSELLLGEEFMLIDTIGEHGWGYCRHDHYVGYVPLSALAESNEGDTRLVTVREAALHKSPDDASVSGTLSIGCKVNGTPNGDWLETDLGYIALEALDGHFADSASVAEALLDTPYVWGGRTGHGIDCSGLVQMSFALARGINTPRDSDQQLHGVGDVLPEDAELQRDDLVFFPGHVGIMADADTLLHATMHHGKTVREPLAEVIARIAKKHDTPVLARKRIS